MEGHWFHAFMEFLEEIYRVHRDTIFKLPSKPQIILFLPEIFLVHQESRWHTDDKSMGIKRRYLDVNALLHVYLRRWCQQKLLSATENMMKINCQRLLERITSFRTSYTSAAAGWRGTCTPRDKSSLRMPSRSSTGHCNHGSETRSCFPGGWESTPWGMFRHLTWVNRGTDGKSMYVLVRRRFITLTE